MVENRKCFGHLGFQIRGREGDRERNERKKEKERKRKSDEEIPVSFHTQK